MDSRAFRIGYSIGIVSWSLLQSILDPCPRGFPEIFGAECAICHKVCPPDLVKFQKSPACSLLVKIRTFVLVSVAPKVDGSRSGLLCCCSEVSRPYGAAYAHFVASCCVRIVRSRSRPRSLRATCPDSQGGYTRNAAGLLQDDDEDDDDEEEDDKKEKSRPTLGCV